jgi:signal transduction histidine kinase/CheY-like chemotaxis protein
MAEPPAARTRWWQQAALGLIAVGLVPIAVLVVAQDQAARIEQDRFAATAGRAVSTIERRIQLYEQVLHGTRGMIAASEQVTASEWGSFAAAMTRGQISAARGLGWAIHTSRAAIPILQGATGIPTGNAMPVPIGTGDACLVVAEAYPSDFAEALVWTCLEDDPAAAEAIIQATASGATALSGPMAASGDDSLVLLLMPMFSGQEVPASGSGRTAALRGVVFVALDVNDLAGDVLLATRDIDHIRIYDGPADSGRLLGDRSVKHAESAPVQLLPIAIAGRSWTVAIESRSTSAATATLVPWLLAAATAGLGLLGLLVVVQFRSRDERARILAERMTADLRLVQTELRTALDAAQEAARAKDGFLAVMSHELRTPLNGVIGMTNLLLDSELTAEQRDFAETARSCANGLLEVINDILDYSRLEAGRTPIEDIPFDPRELLEEILQVVADRAQAKGLELAGESDPRLGQRLRGDPSRLRQLLLNLAANAIKFTEQGEVVVSIRLARDHAHRPLVRLAVRDTGIGIDADHLAGLFQPFTQADGSISRRFGGTGLGLAISKRLAETMGGSIAANSVLGNGSEFVAEIPLGYDQPSDASTPPAELSGRLALVIDDHPIARSMATAILGDYACEVVAATTLAEGRDLLGTSVPDLVIHDVAGHTDDALALVAAVRSHPGWGDLPMVLLTRLGSPAWPIPDRCLTVSKPPRRRQLRDAAITVLGGRAESGTSRIPRRFHGTHVVAADGRLGNLRIMSAILTELGCHTDLASDTREALAACARVPQAVLLLAADLPPLGASAAAQQLRAAGHRGPIFACGGPDRNVPAHCDAWVPLPPRGSDLARLLAHIGER